MMTCCPRFRSFALFAGVCVLSGLLMTGAAWLPAQDRTAELPTPPDAKDQAALAEAQVAIKRAGVRIAEVHKKIAMTKVTALQARLPQLRAEEAVAEKELRRVEALAAPPAAVSARDTDELRVRWLRAKGDRMALEGDISERELGVALADAHVDLARAELEEAELRLRQARARLEGKR